MGEVLKIYHKRELEKYIKEGGILRIPKKYEFLTLCGRHIKSLHGVKMIDCSLRVDYSSTFNDFGDVEVINGGLQFSITPLYEQGKISLNKIKRINGKVSLNEFVYDIGDLEHVGGDFKAYESGITSLNNLNTVDGSMILPRLFQTQNISVNVKGDLKFRKESKTLYEHQYWTLPEDIIIDPDIPYWKHTYIYNGTEIDSCKTPIKRFYKKFMNAFLNGTPIDTLGQENYSFTLMFYITASYDYGYINFQKFKSYLDKLSLYYPRTGSYCRGIVINKLKADKKYEEAWAVYKDNTTLGRHNLPELLEYEKLLKRELIFNDIDILISLTTSGSLTEIGLKNKKTIHETFKKLVEIDIIEHLGYKSITGLFFKKRELYSMWDLFKMPYNHTTLKSSEIPRSVEFFEKLLNYDLAKDYRWGEDPTGYHFVHKQGDESIYLDESNRVSNMSPFHNNFVMDALRRYLFNKFYEAENTFRKSKSLPLRGENKWKSEAELLAQIKESFPNEKIVAQGSPDWLGSLRFDIYFPKKNIAIEYQGLQHYIAIDYFGGEEGLNKTKERDARKRYLSKKYDCVLILVDEGYLFSEVKSEISKILDLRKDFNYNVNYTIQKNPKNNSSGFSSDSKQLIKITGNTKIFDCKNEIELTMDELKKEFPNLSINHFNNNESYKKRYILFENKADSKINKGWKTILDEKDNKIYRFNKIGFANFVGVNQNNVWAFFNGKQKKFKRRFTIID